MNRYIRNSQREIVGGGAFDAPYPYGHTAPLFMLLYILFRNVCKMQGQNRLFNIFNRVFHIW